TASLCCRPTGTVAAAMGYSSSSIRITSPSPRTLTRLTPVRIRLDDPSMTLIRQAAVGPPLESTVRRRPVGRVGGVLGRNVDASALPRALGPHAQVLGAGGTDLEVDWDSCWLDGTLVESLDHWQALLAAGRLAAVEGAFALGWHAADGTL